MESIETTEITVPLKYLKDAVEILIVEDVYFYVMPYPDGDYKVGVRTCEAAHALQPIVTMIALNG